MALFDRLQIGISLPFTPLLQGQIIDTSGTPTGQNETARGFGDLRLEAKTQLAVYGDDDQYSLGVLGGVTIPTAKLGGASLDTPISGGGSAYYLGDKSFTGRFKVIGGLQIGGLRAAVNAGVLLRESSQSFAANVGHELLYGARGRVRGAQARRADGRALRAQRALELHAVLLRREPVRGRRRPARRRHQHVGADRSAAAAASARASARRRAAGSWRSAFAPDFRDRDHDGVYDVDDRCPDQPEDRDGFQDEDGCPDPDNDNDGIPDAQDKCPNDAEDIDSSRTRTAAPTRTTTRTASPT